MKDLLAQTDEYLQRLGAMVAMERLEDYDRMEDNKVGMSNEERKALRDKRAKAKGCCFFLYVSRERERERKQH